MLHGLNSIPKPVFRTQTHTKERTKKVPKMYFFSAKLRLNCRRQICLCGHRTEEEDVCREGRGLLLLLSLLRRLKRRRRSVRYIEFPSSFFCGETPFDVHTDEGREGTHVGKSGDKPTHIYVLKLFSTHSCAQFLPKISKQKRYHCSKNRIFHFLASKATYREPLNVGIIKKSFVNYSQPYLPVDSAASIDFF